ncbi:MAG: DUF4292 domain-containing protein [Taibaiella sp.]|nr:DUF4292 domain-containing protein [Taibaiella sp.]
MNRIVLIWIPLLLLVFASCKPGKKLARKGNKTADTSAVDSLATVPQPQIDIFDVKADGHMVIMELPVDTANLYVDTAAAAIPTEYMLPAEVPFSTFKGKAKMNYSGGGMSQDFTANIRMAKDSVIWIHVTAGMGLVNVARILITPDSFSLLNYLDKTGMKLHISEANQLLPAQVDFKTLQSFIIGEVLRTPYQRVAATRDMGDTWVMDIQGLNTNQVVNYSKADSTINNLQVLSTNGGFAGVIQFANYTIVSSRRFALNRDININSNNELHHLDMIFNNAGFDEALDFPFAIPDSYSLNK